MAQMHRTHDALKNMMEHIAVSYDVAERAQKKTQIREQIQKAQYQAQTSQLVGINANTAAGAANTNANGRILDANGAVLSRHVNNANIQNQHLSTGTVGSGQIINGAVGNADLGNSIVTSTKIGDVAVNTNHLAGGAVTGAKIANGTISGSNVASNTLTGTHIAGGAIGNSELASGAVGSGQIINGAVGTSQVASANKDGGFATPSMRSIGGAASWTSGGTSQLASSANHAHSISFKALPKDERRNAIALAEKIAARESKDAKYNELREMVLLLFRLAADDIDVDRHEREQIIDESEDGDSLEHELYMQHDYIYYARHMLQTDAKYRVLCKHDPRLAKTARTVEGVTELENTFVLDEELDEDGNLKPEHAASYERIHNETVPRDHAQGSEGAPRFRGTHSLRSSGRFDRRAWPDGAPSYR